MKHFVKGFCKKNKKSPPARGRGLKLIKFLLDVSYC